jgi:hypothetical protein
MRYVEVLTDVFPEPVNKKELAQRTGVSRAAVSKVKERLYGLCNVEALAYKAKMILRCDTDTFLKLFSLYASQMKLDKLLLSNYGWHMIQKFQIHDQISQQLKEYSTHFTEEDTERMIKVVFQNLPNIRVEEQIGTKIKDPQQRAIFLSFQYAQAFGNFLNNFVIPVEDKEDLILVLLLRDKLFFFVKNIACQLIKKTDILATLANDEERTQYLEVYENTIDFYLRKLFEIGTELIKRTAESKSLIFEPSYGEIGHFFHP